MKSRADTVDAYLAELPPDRREAIETVRNEILERLPDGCVETMGFGMISYVVPLEVYPDTYNKQPLMYVALASQKNHMAVYLSAIYRSAQRRAEFNLRMRRPENGTTAARVVCGSATSKNYH